MKFKDSNQKPKKWLLTLFLAFCFFSINGLQAQTYVSSDVAVDRLTDKAQQLDNQVAQGAITQVDHEVNTTLVKYVLNEIENYDFVWNTENQAEIIQIFENVLQIGETNTDADYPQHASKIDAFKAELDVLLQQ